MFHDPGVSSPYFIGSKCGGVWQNPSHPDMSGITFHPEKSFSLAWTIDPVDPVHLHQTHHGRTEAEPRAAA